MADPAGKGVKRSPGPDFGPGGDGYTRLDFGTSRPVLDEIVRRLTTG